MEEQSYSVKARWFIKNLTNNDVAVSLSVGITGIFKKFMKYDHLMSWRLKKNNISISKKFKNSSKYSKNQCFRYLSIQNNTAT